MVPMSESAHSGLQRGWSHRLVPMTGRDPDEAHRTASPLELLFDLTFVVAFSQASSQLAHLLADGHTASAVLGFSYSMVAICLAWINFTWFASAYDTDDWFFRITTMVQMTGVLVLALGLPAVFHSIDNGEYLDNRVVVAGYVIMRIAMVAQWLRAARSDSRSRGVALAYAGFIATAQVGWIALAIVDVPLVVFCVLALALYLLEFGGPLLAERRFTSTGWHPHHIAERYGLLTIIALGEVILGSVASISAVVESQGWSLNAVLLAGVGVSLAFGLWWMYFVLPAGDLLARFRSRSWTWGYGHIVVFAAVAAIGAGLHVAAYVVEGVAEIDVTRAVMTVAVPVAVYCVALFVLDSFLLGELVRYQVLPYLGALLLLVIGVTLAQAGAGLGISLVAVTAAPAVVVIAFELGGHRRQTLLVDRVMG